MRKIKVDSILLTAVDKFAAELSKNDEKESHPKKKLEALSKKVRKKSNGKLYSEYLDKIILNYEEIILAGPVTFKKWQDEFDSILNHKQLQECILSKKNPFHKNVVIAMRYGDYRSNIFPRFYYELKIKTCVYCNAVLTVVLDEEYVGIGRKKKKKYKANFELDHFFPKSKYPFFCTSPFNLLPVCSNCNKSKSDKSTYFSLFVKNGNLDEFEFSLTDASIIEYYFDQNYELLEIDFKHRFGKEKIAKEHDEMFNIKRIYNTQKDLAEEILLKAHFYNDIFKESLIQNFHEVFPDKDFINRLILGNYIKPEDIHKRPMAKFTQDIAKQLGLI
jgi:5-methylcytosine-specific restriction endonuclease McrA